MLTEAAVAAIALFLLSRLRRARKVQAKAPSKAVTSTPTPKFEVKRAMVPKGASEPVLKELTVLNDEIIELEDKQRLLQQAAFVDEEIPWVVISSPISFSKEPRGESEALLDANFASIALREQRLNQILIENPSIEWAAR